MSYEDPFGLALSTQSEPAAEAYNEALLRFLQVQDGALEAAIRSCDHDPMFALSWCVRGLAHRTAGDIPTSTVELSHATELVDAHGVTDRERSHVTLFKHLATGATAAFESSLLAHLRIWPRDATTAYFVTFFYNIMSPAPDRDARMLEVAESVTPAYGHDWFGQSLLAFACEENRQFHRAGDLAALSLTQRPTNGRAAHTLAHVRLETGSATVGAPWLKRWTTDWIDPGPFLCHLRWHGALFELALGDTAAAIRSLDEVMAWTGRALAVQSDGPSLAWRLHLDGHATSHWPALVSFACPVGPAFMNVHRALALAGLGDTDGLEVSATAHEALGPENATAAVVAGLCRALAAFVIDDYGSAADEFGRLRPSIRTVGGSHAQTEVFHDTHIAALERSGRTAEAGHWLRDRLAARASVRDELWLERVAG